MPFNKVLKGLPLAQKSFDFSLKSNELISHLIQVASTLGLLQFSNLPPKRIHLEFLSSRLLGIGGYLGIELGNSWVLSEKVCSVSNDHLIPFSRAGKFEFGINFPNPCFNKRNRLLNHSIRNLKSLCNYSMNN